MPKFPTLAHIDFAYTMVPDYFLDQIAPTLKECELKVMLYIYRRTLGYRKLADSISYDQFIGGITTRDGRQLDRGAGVSRRALVTALASLEERGLIERGQSKSRTGSLIQLTPAACGNSLAEVSQNSLTNKEAAVKLDPGKKPARSAASPAPEEGASLYIVERAEVRPVEPVQNLPVKGQEKGQDLTLAAFNPVQNSVPTKESPHKNQSKDMNQDQVPAPVNRLPFAADEAIEAAVGVLYPAVAGLSRREARRLSQLALQEHERDLAYLQQLVDYVKLTPGIQVPAAVITSLIKANAERSLPTSPTLAFPTTGKLSGEPSPTYPAREANRAGRLPANRPLDLSKYTGNGKYSYLSHKSEEVEQEATG